MAVVIGAALPRAGDHVPLGTHEVDLSRVLAPAAEAVGGATPWWGVPAVAGAFAVGGALITLLFNWRRDRREHSRRWERDLRDLCARYLTEAGETHDVHDPLSGSERTDRRDASRRLRRIHSEMLLLADAEVTDAALLLWAAALRLEPIDLPDALRESPNPYSDATDAFVAAARKSLGVKSKRKKRIIIERW